MDLVPYGNLLKIPIECIYIIVSHLYPKTIGALKNTCGYLSNLMSINRINNFILGNNKSRSSFFKAIVKQNNGGYTQRLLEYAKKEPFDNESFKTEYLGPLLKYAIKQNKEHVVDVCMSNGIGTLLIYDGTPLHMAACYDSDLVIQVLINHSINTGDDIQAVDSNGYTALYVAWSKKNQNAVRVLEQYDKNSIEYYAREHRLIRTKKRRDIICSIVPLLFVSMVAGFITLIVAICTDFFGTTACSAHHPQYCHNGTH